MSVKVRVCGLNPPVPLSARNGGPAEQESLAVRSTRVQARSSGKVPRRRKVKGHYCSIKDVVADKSRDSPPRIACFGSGLREREGRKCRIKRILLKRVSAGYSA